MTYFVRMRVRMCSKKKKKKRSGNVRKLLIVPRSSSRPYNAIRRWSERVKTQFHLRFSLCDVFSFSLILSFFLCFSARLASGNGVGHDKCIAAWKSRCSLPHNNWANPGKGHLVHLDRWSIGCETVGGIDILFRLFGPFPLIYRLPSNRLSVQWLSQHRFDTRMNVKLARHARRLIRRLDSYVSEICHTRSYVSVFENPVSRKVYIVARSHAHYFAKTTDRKIARLQQLPEKSTHKLQIFKSGSGVVKKKKTIKRMKYIAPYKNARRSRVYYDCGIARETIGSWIFRR